jgi:hypothetical protein
VQFAPLPRERGEEDKAQNPAADERRDSRGERERSERGPCCGQMVKPKTAGHAHSESSVTRQIDRHAAEEANRTGSVQRRRRQRDHLLAAVGEPDDPRNKGIVQIGVGVSGKQSPLPTPCLQIAARRTDADRDDRREASASWC